jgi:hypothetical protein
MPKKRKQSNDPFYEYSEDRVDEYGRIKRRKGKKKDEYWIN